MKMQKLFALAAVPLMSLMGTGFASAAPDTVVTGPRGNSVALDRTPGYDGYYGAGYGAAFTNPVFGSAYSPFNYGGVVTALDYPNNALWVDTYGGDSVHVVTDANTVWGPGYGYDNIAVGSRLGFYGYPYGDSIRASSISNSANSGYNSGIVNTGIMH